MPPEAQRAIHQLFGNLIKVISARNTVDYDAALLQLPEEFRDRYHELLLKGVMYVVLLFDVRRGRDFDAAIVSTSSRFCI